MFERIALVVDVIGVSRAKIRDYLKKDGYHVFEAGHPTKALELISQTRFDLIITDMKLPEMSGFDLFKQACENGSVEKMGSYSEPPFILKSGEVHPSTVKQARQAGFAAVVSETISCDHFLRVVADVVSGAVATSEVDNTFTATPQQPRASVGHTGMNEYRISYLYSLSGDWVSHFELSGSISKGSGFLDIQSEAIKEIHSGKNILVFDFSNVNYINSSGIAGLLTLRQAIQDSGGRLVLVNMQEPIAKVFQNLNLFKIFPYYESLNLAMRRIGIET